MPIFDRLNKMFHDKSADVSCPKCSRSAKQSMYKLRNNITILCPHCGYYFLGGED
ncbi:YnfU family zinc-binding protein [Morganella morganii]